MRRFINLVQGALVFSLLFVWADQVFAQSRQAGEVRGTVVDQQGGVVPGVTVTITNVLTGVSQRVATNTGGVYDAASVPPGEYTILFEKEGFTRFDRTGIVLHLETITVDATLQVGSVSQSIEVKGAAPLVQTETPEGSTTITTTAVTDTPNVGRSWYNLLGLMPGVSGGGAGQGANGEGASVNGQGGYQYNWQIDGGHAMFTNNQNPDILATPLDDIQEIKLVTGNFGAEYGNGLAVFNVTTKSGTNAWHGALFEYVQNDKLEARNYFSPGNLPLRWNEFGGTVGGPIRRDKAFFFFSYQANPTVTDSPAFANMPTAAMRSGNFTDPIFPKFYDPATLQQVNGNWTEQPFTGNSISSNRFDPAASKIIQYFPQPNLPGSALNYYYTARVPQTTQWISGKVDYNVSSSNHITASLMITPNWFGNPAPVCAIDCTTWHNRENTAQVTDVWTFSPQLVGEFRFSMVHMHGEVKPLTLGAGYPAKLGLQNPAYDVFPSVTVDGVSASSIGAQGWPLAIDAESAFVPAGTVTWIEGKHILKFGGEFDRWWINQGWPMANEGNFDFSGTFTRNPSDPNSAGLGWADFLLGLPDTWSVSYGPETGARMWSGQTFAQDEYKVRPNLTLTVGLRWVVQSGYSEEHNRITNFDSTLFNSGSQTLGALWYAGQGGRRALENTIWDFFDPRVGFAWEPRHNWSVRGGYGLYNMTWGGYAYNSSSPGLGWATQGFETSTDMIHPIFTLSQGPPPPIYPTDALRTAEMLNGQDITYTPRNMPMGYSEQYRLDVQHQAKGGVLLDVAYVGNRGLHLPFARDINQVPESLLGPGNAQANRPYPQYAAINGALAGDFSNYNGLQMTVRRDFSNGLLLLANYTWAKAMDTMTVNGWGGVPAPWQNAFDIQADYGPSSADIRHMFNGNFVYELPVGWGKRFLNGGSGLLNGVIGGWEISSMFQLHSGLPFTPVIGTANLSGALSGTWRPNRIGNGTLSHPTIAEWFDPSAFVQPAPYTFGNSGRNILYSPGWKDMDLSLVKSFKLKEGVSLRFTAEAFDVFNVSNFGFPDPGIGDGTTGIITSANTSRTVQVGAKLQF